MEFVSLISTHIIASLFSFFSDKHIVGDHGDSCIFLLVRFVIIDEAHAYKGAFGCHTALIIRRLRRLCSHGKFFNRVCNS